MTPVVEADAAMRDYCEADVASAQTLMRKLLNYQHPAQLAAAGDWVQVEEGPHKGCYGRVIRVRLFYPYTYWVRLLAADLSLADVPGIYMGVRRATDLELLALIGYRAAQTEKEPA